MFQIKSLWTGIFLLISALFFNLYTLYPQFANQNKFPLKSLSVNEGLQTNSIFDIDQDKNGFLYFASPDGLSKWDGKEFKFYPKNFVSESDIVIYDDKVYIDKQNQIWINTGEGFIEKFDSITNRFNRALHFPFPKSMYQDSNYNMYVGTSNYGLFKIDNLKKDTLQVLHEKDFPEHIHAITEYNSKIWSATTNGILTIDRKNKYQYIADADNFGKEYTSITSSKKHGVWAGTYQKGIYKYDHTTNKLIHVSEINGQSLPTDLYVHTMFFDSQDKLWIGTYGSGVYFIDFELGKIQQLANYKYDPTSLSYDAVTSIFEDSATNIWICTDGGGANLYDSYLFKFKKLSSQDLPKDMNLNMIKSLEKDTGSGLWISTHNYGLFHFNTDTYRIRQFNDQNSLLRSNKIQFIKLIKHKLWIATENNEIQVMDSLGNFRTYGKFTTPRLDISYIYEIYEDSNGNIWLTTTEDGLVLFDEEQGIIDKYTPEPENKNSLSSNLIFSIKEDHNNNLWLGTKYKGLCRLNLVTKKIDRFPQVEGMIRTIYVDKKNTIWLGTNGDGLIKFNPETLELKTYSTDDGLAGNVVYCILPDRQNNLWLSSNSGLTKFNQKDESTVIYDQHDGLQSLEFNDSAGLVDTINNTLYFGGSKGLNWFNPALIKKNPVKPKTVIKKIEVFSEEQPITEKPIFKYNKNTLTFTFAALHFSLPEENQYKYRLVGFEDDFTSSKKSNSVRYTNLAPGTYEFQVISSNYDGVWNTNPAMQSFTILKPWYTTNLAMTVYGFLLLLGIYGFYRYFKWRWHIKIKLSQEQNEKERLKKLDEVKNKLYTNISHEIRTPLTLISGPVENQLSKKNLTEEDKRELTLIKRSSDRLLNLVNQMLDLSKLESGNLRLMVSQGNLKVFLLEIISFFEFKAKEKGINFESFIDCKESAWFDKDSLEKIISNLLSNAVKYSSENGKIKVKAQQHEHHLIFNVVNDSRNLKQQDLSKIFDRFYQGDNNNDGAGIGLSLVKELVTRLHGEIAAQLIDKNKVQFTLTLPTESSYFAPDILAKNMKRKSQIFNSQTEEDITMLIGNKKKPLLLLVEDDLDIRHYIKSIFKTDYRIEEASNGQEGLKKSFESNPDLIISDVMMPVMDGIHMCNTLKFDTRTSHIPIVLLTAKSGQHHEIKGLKTGADAYINKPFNREKLVITVQKLIDLRLKLQKHFSQYLSITPDIAITSTENQFLMQLKKVLDTHITDPDFNSEFFCMQMGISRTQLHRKLTAIVGMPTTEFIRSQRLKLASQLLLNTDASVSEVAYQVGFSTPSYFNRCFKEHFGKTPSSFKS